MHAQHKLGHGPCLRSRARLVLRDGLGERIGAAVFFHPAESVDALPHGETGEDAGVERKPSGTRGAAGGGIHEDFVRGETPFGVLWITVDQAHELRKTHGARACEAMLEKVERTLANGLRPAEETGAVGRR